MLTSQELHLLETLSELTYCNPFQPRRIELEHRALGTKHQPDPDVAWSRNRQSEETGRPNVSLLRVEAERLAEQLRTSFLQSTARNLQLATLYEDLIIYVLYYRHIVPFYLQEEAFLPRQVTKLWRAFKADFDHFLNLPEQASFATQPAEHLFACLYQVKRAFQHIFDFILGDSLPAARLRGMVWQSIFTHDMRRYRRTLYAQMGEISTLITGPSGTGKELVARAIGLSQYVAFDSSRERFQEEAEEAFIPLNLSALSPTLIESELFGHIKGSFTGAMSDRIGWLERCRSYGAVFLDEIGELAPAIQVKLLRVVQTRLYSRLGETTARSFQGKLITATNRDLAEEMQAGRFRMDLYYRLCSDHIQTPSLKEQLESRPEALSGLIHFLANRVAGQEAESVAAEVETWISQHLPADYNWPGNIRELEQCVRNIMIRQTYVPRQPSSDNPAQLQQPEWLTAAKDRRLTAEELLRGYITWVYAQEKTYEATAALLKLDRRTVKSKVDTSLLPAFAPDYL